MSDEAPFHLTQHGEKFFAVVIGHHPERIPDHRIMVWNGTPEAFSAFWTQVDAVHTAIKRVYPPLDEPRGLHAIQKAADVALRDQQLSGQLLLGDALTQMKRGQDVELGRSQPVSSDGLLHPSIETLEGTDELQPGPHDLGFLEQFGLSSTLHRLLVLRVHEYLAFPDVPSMRRLAFSGAIRRRSETPTRQALEFYTC